MDNRFDSGAAAADADLSRWLRALERATGARAALRLDGDACWPDRTDAPATVALEVDGRVVGSLSLHPAEARPLAAADLAALDDAAAAIANVLALRSAARAATRSRDLVAAQAAVHELIAREAPLREILLAILESIERADPTLIASLLQLDASTGTLHSALGPSLPADYLAGIDGVPVGPDIGTCGSAAWFGRLTVSPDIASDPKWAPIAAVARAVGLAHCWSMPIASASGDVLGTLAFYGRAPREPEPEHLELLQAWSRVAAIAIEGRRGLDLLLRDARHDTLTGLPNRAAVHAALDAAAARVAPGAPAAVLFVDLDGLKEVNDTLGHDRADDAIRETAERLADAMAPHGFIGRVGGDEFVAVVEGIRDRDEAGVVGVTLLNAVSRPLSLLGGRVVTASIGIALIAGDGDVREVLQAADAAMYEAKRSGRDRVIFFDGEAPAHRGRRLQLARALHRAEIRGELRLGFHPVVSLPARELVGVEALLRWQSPEHGDVVAEELVPIAEETGSILPIGTWSLRESCETVARLDPGGQVELAVNVSAHQVSDPDFALWVRQILRHAGLPPARLAIELTEAALLRPSQVVDANLGELHGLGVRLVLDGFGMAYSPLAWLRRHPFSGIKIDRSFVADVDRNPRGHAIVASVIALADAIGCTVTAVGIETTEQLEQLERLGCRRAQGFLLAPVVPAERLGTLLARERPAADAA